MELAFIDSAWAGPVNTALFVVLAILARRNGKKADRAADAAEDAATNAKAVVQVVAQTRRHVKESHNALANILREKYESGIDPGTGLFREREDDGA